MYIAMSNEGPDEKCGHGIQCFGKLLPNITCDMSLFSDQ